jgi:hypothetical protein
VTPNRRRCAACLKWIEFGQARLMWSREGTYRLCKRDVGCKKRARKRLRDLEVAFAHNGGRGVEDAETIDALRAYVR